MKHSRNSQETSVNRPTLAQTELQVGDLVDVTLDNGQIERRRVQYPPWQAFRTRFWLIGLEGMQRSFPLERCRLVERAKAKRRQSEVAHG